MVMSPVEEVDPTPMDVGTGWGAATPAAAAAAPVVVPSSRRPTPARALSIRPPVNHSAHGTHADYQSKAYKAEKLSKWLDIV